MDVNGFLTELKNTKTNDCLILIDLLFLYFYFCAEDSFAVNLKTQFRTPELREHHHVMVFNSYKIISSPGFVLHVLFILFFRTKPTKLSQLEVKKTFKKVFLFFAQQFESVLFVTKLRGGGEKRERERKKDLAGLLLSFTPQNGDV